MTSRPPARIVVAAALLGLSAPALATPTFPSALRRELSMSSEPNCSLCHTNGVTALGTVTTPFGTSMRERELIPHQEPTLAAALRRMRSEGVDSDGDGAADLDELTAGNDPNGPGRLRPGAFDPRYGCGADHSGGASPSLLALAVTLAAGWVTRRRATSPRS